METVTIKISAKQMRKLEKLCEQAEAFQREIKNVNYDVYEQVAKAKNNLIEAIRAFERN